MMQDCKKTMFVVGGKSQVLLQLSGANTWSMSRGVINQIAAQKKARDKQHGVDTGEEVLTSPFANLESLEIRRRGGEPLGIPSPQSNNQR